MPLSARKNIKTWELFHVRHNDSLEKSRTALNEVGLDKWTAMLSEDRSVPRDGQATLHSESSVEAHFSKWMTNLFSYGILGQ